MAKRKTVPNPYDPPQDWVAFENTATSARYPEVYHRRTLGAFEQFRQDAPNQVELSFSSGFRLQITAWTAAVWRIRYTRGAYDRLPSVALNPTIEPQNIQLKVQEEDGQCVISSAAVAVKVNKTDGRLHFVNLANDETILAETEAYQERYSILGGTHHLRTSFAAEKDEVYYGLGDKSWDLNLRGRHFQNWNSDSFGYHKEQDPLYRTIPFYYGLKASGAYGIFFHNTGRTHFDFDSRKDGVTRMWSEVGEMDYFFCFGPELDTVAQQYHYLTGTPELPPLWALGFHQCRWSYYPESRVRELAT
ncbi:MAG: TIM-barrel domain-containing protein, partial [Bacteroidota bacterium]